MRATATHSWIKNVPDLAQRAEQADADWMGKLPLMDDGPTDATYRKLYAHMYRHHSGYEHPSALGLLAVAEDQPDGSTHISIEPLIDFEVLYLANVLDSRSLYIASLTMGWPDANEVAAVWAERLRLKKTCLSSKEQLFEEVPVAARNT